jgi:quercetin dioxygenase-like cupin family protein
MFRCRLPLNPRLFTLLSLLIVFVVAVTVGPNAQTPATTAGQGRGTPTNITGGVRWSEDTSNVRVLRLRFSAGSRSNWHTHLAWGQLLMIEEGRGRHQVRGGPIQEILPGQPWFTPAGVEHWHGAAPDQEALQLTIMRTDAAAPPQERRGTPVTDEEYLGKPAPRR